MEICKKCGGEVAQSYCPNCGSPIELKRIDGQYITKEITSVFLFDKGILFTIKELMLRPGQSVRSFIHNDRNRLVKPIVFIIVCSLVYTIAQQLLQFEDGYVSAGGFNDSAINGIFEWIQSHYGYANILMAVFIALWIKVFFRKYAYNFFEILILLCFVMGLGMLIYTAFGIVESALNFKVLHLGGLVGFLYSAWAIGQFFDKKQKSNYVKGLLAYLLGMMTFFLAATLLGLGVDMLQGVG